jgi:5-methylcytosine-specific restriction endonuclease McrA
VLRRDGYRCQVCGSTEDLEAHHLIPVADGGAHEAGNLEVRCRAATPKRIDRGPERIVDGSTTPM